MEPLQQQRKHQDRYNEAWMVAGPERQGMKRDGTFTNIVDIRVYLLLPKELPRRPKIFDLVVRVRDTQFRHVFLFQTSC